MCIRDRSDPPVSCPAKVKVVSPWNGEITGVGHTPVADAAAAGVIPRPVTVGAAQMAAAPPAVRWIIRRRDRDWAIRPIRMRRAGREPCAPPPDNLVMWPSAPNRRALVQPGPKVLDLGIIGVHRLTNGCGDIESASRLGHTCLLYTSPSPRDRQKSRMPSSA